MRRRRCLCLLLVCAAAVAAPAAATPPPDNPTQLCGENDIYVRVTEWRGQTIIRELQIATHGGCASSWATGNMSIAAVAGQCKRLEEGVIIGGQPFTLTYPHMFYGIWLAENRSDCIKILHGLATGELDADVLPFPA
jgi:hypothetical protein